MRQVCEHRSAPPSTTKAEFFAPLTGMWPLSLAFPQISITDSVCDLAGRLVVSRLEVTMGLPSAIN